MTAPDLPAAWNPGCDPILLKYSMTPPIGMSARPGSGRLPLGAIKARFSEVPS